MSKQTNPESVVREIRRKTRRVHELWQTDFTYMKVIGWGWYYLSTILDEHSRYIIAWILSTGMAASDVRETLDRAVEKTGVTDARVRHRPRLLSDNGPAYVSKELETYLAEKEIEHTRGRPYHPMTQGKIERSPFQTEPDPKTPRHQPPTRGASFLR